VDIGGTLGGHMREDGHEDTKLVHELLAALRYLYDPVKLGECGLLVLLGIDSSSRSALEVQTQLIDAIDALRPTADVPEQANAWRYYYVLSQRHVEQYNQVEIAANLGLSTRQVRRLHRQAVRALADSLARRSLQAAQVRLSPEAPASSALQQGSENAFVRSQEMDRLKRSAPTDLVDIGAALDSAITVVGPLADAFHVSVKRSVPEGLPPVLGPWTAVRHALLTALSVEVRWASHGEVAISLRREREGVEISLQNSRILPCGVEEPQTRRDALQVVCELMALCGGSAQFDGDPGSQALSFIRLLFPVARQFTVLVIDDNADTLELFERYVTGTQYRCLGVQDATQALAVAIREAPDIIVLDLMLPVIDGWDLLARLREQPRTRHIPVIICTILPEEDLALVLGAVALLHKPVSRSAFVMALERARQQPARR
jgi:CheY-like chemotaxis protein